MSRQEIIKHLDLIHRLNRSERVSLVRDGKKIYVPVWEAVQLELEALIKNLEESDVEHV